VFERYNVVGEEDLRDAVQRICQASKEDLERLNNQRSSGYEAGAALFKVLERGQAGHWPPQPFETGSAAVRGVGGGIRLA
jgi:hypothetical protein